MNKSVIFSRLMEEYGNLDQEDEIEKGADKKRKPSGTAVESDNAAQAPLMQAEERVTGAVTFKTYSKYLRYGGGLFWAPTIAIILTLYQGSQGTNTFAVKRLHISLCSSQSPTICSLVSGLRRASTVSPQERIWVLMLHSVLLVPCFRFY